MYLGKVEKLGKEKKLYTEFISVAVLSIESQLTQEEGKVGILKIIPPLKSFII